MDEARVRQLVEALIAGADELHHIAGTAMRGGKSIAPGRGRYAERFHDEVVKVTKVEKLLAPVVQAIPGFDTAFLTQCLGVLKQTAPGLPHATKHASGCD